MLRRVPPSMTADGQHDRVEDVEAPRDHRLQRGDHLRGRGDRVLGAVRRRAVTALAADHDREVAAGRHHRAGPAEELGVGIHRGEDVHAVRRVGAPSRRVEHALLDHHAGAVPALLAGLEHQHHVAAQVVAVLGEQPGAADQARGVQVVPAGVHRAVGGRELEPGLLGDGQRVHVGAQQHRLRVGLVAGPAAQHRGHRGGVGAGGDLQAEAVELLEHLLLRARQVEPDLRGAVQVLAQLGQVAGHAPGVVVQVHGVSSGQVVGRVRQLDRVAVPTDQITELVAEVGHDAMSLRRDVLAGRATCTRWSCTRRPRRACRPATAGRWARCR